MIAFWLAAGALLLAALAFLLIPTLRGRRAQAEEDRTALNVALYQERIAALDAQHAAGALDAAQLEAGRAEAGRELLADAEQGNAGARRSLGRWLPLSLALLVPLLALGLYLHWGASDALKLREELATAPKTMDEMAARMEAVVKAQPESAEAWYFLGRTYMAQQRAADAALADADTRAKLAASGMEVAPGSSQQLKDAISQEIKIHAELVKAAGLVPQ